MLTRAIPAAAWGPVRNADGRYQNVGIEDSTPTAHSVTAAIARNGLFMYDVRGTAIPPTKQGTATCQTRSLVRSA
jgi:hypothetical protein